MTYRGQDALQPVRIPTSDDNLTILSLDIEEGGATERFAQGADGLWVRYFDAEGPALTLRCCYRTRSGREALPRPNELFVGASTITTLRPPPARSEWP